MLMLGIMKFMSTQIYKHGICVNLSESNIFVYLFKLVGQNILTSWSYYTFERAENNEQTVLYVTRWTWEPNCSKACRSSWKWIKIEAKKTDGKWLEWHKAKTLQSLFDLHLYVYFVIEGAFENFHHHYS
jgi:hypothetical protein